MASQIGTVNGKTSKVPSEEPALKFNMEEFCELKKLETAGDMVGVQDLKKRVRRRMESEQVSSGPKTSTSTTTTTTTSTSTSKKSKLVTAAASTLNTNGVKDDKKMVVNQKRLETNTSTSKNPTNMVSNEDKKKEKFKLTSKSTSESLSVVKKEKNVTNKEKPKPKSSSLGSKNFTTTNNGVNIHIHNNSSNLSNRKPVKSTSTKDSSFNSFLRNEKNFVKNSKHSTINNTGTKDSSRKNVKQSSQKFEMYVEQWKLRRERGDKYMPLELFLPTDILNDKDQLVTVKKIAKEFELSRLRRLLEKDKEKPNGNKKLAQQRIEILNNGSNYTRLEIAAFRNEKGPKTEQQIHSHIAFLNEKNIIKHKKLTELDVIEEPYYLKKCAEQFEVQQQKIKQNKEKLLQRKGIIEKQKVLERKRKPEESLEQRRHEKLVEERKRKLQFLERKSEGKLSEQKRHQMSMSEIKRRQEKFVKTEPVQRRHNQIEDLRSKHSSSSSSSSNNNYAPKKMMTNNNNETSTSSTLLKKRTFDRSEAAPSQAPKRRNFGNKELDIYRMDEKSINQNMSSIIHQIFRQGRKPIYGMKDDNDDDVMEVSGRELFREEARSSRLARKEDEDEERAENLRRIKKERERERERELNKKKA